MKSVKHSPIEAANIQTCLSYNNYKNIDFLSFWHGFGNNDNSNNFIHRQGIAFEDYVGCKLLTGNELFYYPELAKKMREIKDYPTLMRTYPIDETIQGIAFIDYFYHRVKETFHCYQSELINASNSVNHLISLLGQDRHIPIIDKIEIETIDDYRKCKSLVINGVRWYCGKNSHAKYKVTDYIDFCRLLTIKRGDFYRIEIEEVKQNTPFVALRIAKTWRHKGHVCWYNLDTCQKVSKAAIGKWKKPI